MAGLCVVGRQPTPQDTGGQVMGSRDMTGPRPARVALCGPVFLNLELPPEIRKNNPTIVKPGYIRCTEMEHPYRIRGALA